ncbi:MAG TPA: response regulator [Thermoanaerobaculaceae bacterium]|nr:response regulator [Acidobacteriota bacterium]HPW54544.1 response regulator [Thermoanaerobaculaceae bacterium]
MGVHTALVADDSRIFRSWLRELLREQGFEVVEAANGREALDLALSVRPHLLVLDALMPLMSGFDVITKLREKVADYHPILFIVTAVYKSRRWESEARLQHQVHEYLEKPLEESTVLAALERHLPGASQPG